MEAVNAARDDSKGRLGGPCSVCSLFYIIIEYMGRGGRNEAWAFTHRYEDQIRHLYDSGLRAPQIAKILNLSYHPIYYRMRRMGLKFTTGKRALPVNHDFFNEIDTEEKAYWLGFLLADGSTHAINNHRVVRLQLCIKDAEHIEKFRLAVGSHCKIGYRNKQEYPSAVLAFSSNLIGEVLARAKTEQTLPWNVPDDLLRHWLRGYIDGDGHIQVNPRPAVVLVGPEQRMSSIGSYLEKSLSITNCKIIPSTNSPTTFRLVYGRREQVRTLLSWLYTENCIALTRKREAAARILVPTAINRPNT